MYARAYGTYVRTRTYRVRPPTRYEHDIPRPDLSLPHHAVRGGRVVAEYVRLERVEMEVGLVIVLTMRAFGIEAPVSVGLVVQAEHLAP